MGVLESIIGLKLFASFLSTLMSKSADMHRVSFDLNERMSNQEEQRLIALNHIPKCNLSTLHAGQLTQNSQCKTCKG